MNTPISTTPVKPLLTPSAVAELLNVTVSTLAIWRCKGSSTLPFVKIGRCVRYRAQDVESYINSQLHIHTDKKLEMSLNSIEGRGE